MRQGLSACTGPASAIPAPARRPLAALVLALAVAGQAAAAGTPLCQGEQAFLRDRITLARRALDANPYQPADGVQAQALALPGARLAGWRVPAQDGAGQALAPRGYLLVLLGDAMLAQDVIPMARALAREGYDVHSFDHRGFGASTGQAGIRQSILDVQALVEHLNAQAGPDGRPRYRQRFVYGMSAGAALGLNALRAGLAIDGFVADGLPASLSHRVGLLFGLFTVSWLDCPPEIDPVNLFAAPLPAPVVLVQGGADRQLALTQTPQARQRLLVRACRAGANVLQVLSWAHPAAGGAEDGRTALLAAYLAAGGRWPVGRPGAVTTLDRLDPAATPAAAACGDEPAG